MGGAGGFATKNAKKKKELTADERTQIGVGEGLAAKRREELKKERERRTSNVERRNQNWRREVGAVGRRAAGLGRRGWPLLFQRVTNPESFQEI